nr:MAG TPA: hypothetical protein [Caudoviricetes sp.]
MGIFYSAKLLHILKICKVLAIYFKAKYTKPTQNPYYHYISHIVKNTKIEILIKYSSFLFAIFA